MLTWKNHMHGDKVFLHFLCITTIACMFLLLCLLGKNLNVSRNLQVTSKNYIVEMMWQGSNQSVVLLDSNLVWTLGLTCQSQVLLETKGELSGFKKEINSVKPRIDALSPSDSWASQKYYCPRVGSCWSSVANLSRVGHQDHVRLHHLVLWVKSCLSSQPVMGNSHWLVRVPTNVICYYLKVVYWLNLLCTRGFYFSLLYILLFERIVFFVHYWETPGGRNERETGLPIFLPLPDHNRLLKT